MRLSATFDGDGAAGFAQTTVKLEGCATAWGCWPLPQNRDLFMVTTGSGSQLVYKCALRNPHPPHRSPAAPTGPRGRDVCTLLALSSSSLFGAANMFEAHTPQDVMG